MALPVLSRVTAAGTDARWSAAVGDLYQACHLQPPGVLFARDEVHFARLTNLMTAMPMPVNTMLLVTLAILLTSAVLALRPDNAGLGAFLSADFGLIVVPCAVWFTPSNLDPSVIMRRTAMRLVTLAAAGLIVAGLTDWYMAAVALALTGAAFLASDLAAPRRNRRAVCAGAIGPIRPGIRALSRGFRPVGDVVHERLRSALSDLGGDTVNRPPDTPIRSEPQRRRWEAMRDELQRLYLPANASPVLGRTVGADYDQAARVSELGLFGTDPTALPRVLQAAVTLDGLAAAVCALDGIAIVARTNKTASWYA